MRVCVREREMADEEERRAVVVIVYDAISLNPCNLFQHAFNATLRYFGSDSEPPPAAADVHDCITEPLVVASSGSGSDDHKHNNTGDRGNYEKPVAESRGSSSSSSSSSGKGHQEQADLQPYTTDDPLPSPDPTSETSDPSVLALGRSRLPPRPPVSSGRGGQTN